MLPKKINFFPSFAYFDFWLWHGWMGNQIVWWHVYSNIFFLQFFDYKVWQLNSYYITWIPNQIKWFIANTFKHQSDRLLKTLQVYTVKSDPAPLKFLGDRINIQIYSFLKSHPLWVPKIQSWLYDTDLKIQSVFIMKKWWEFIIFMP
jgi:hypothetical protein